MFLIKKINKPLLVAALPVASIEDLKKIEHVRNHVDLVELRVDYMDNPMLIPYENFTQEKILVTLRDHSEGGVKKHSDEVKLQLLKRLYDLGMLYDVEMMFLEKYSYVNYEDKIVSYHIFDPSNVDLNKIKEMIEKYMNKALIVKIATVPFLGYKSFLASLLELGDNIAVMPMSTNPQERIAFTLLGSKLLYCCIERPTALGQVRCIDVKIILDTINEHASYVIKPAE